MVLRATLYGNCLRSGFPRKFFFDFITYFREPSLEGFSFW